MVLLFIYLSVGLRLFSGLHCLVVEAAAAAAAAILPGSGLGLGLLLLKEGGKIK